MKWQYTSGHPEAGPSEQSMDHSIPFIDISALFGMPSHARDLTDQAIMAAAAAPGFMVVGGFPPDVPMGRPVRAELLRLFQLPEVETRKLWRQKFDPSHPNKIGRAHV